MKLKIGYKMMVIATYCFSIKQTSILENSNHQNPILKQRKDKNNYGRY